jgi:hypothetical protein
MSSNADPLAPYRIGFDASGYYCLSQVVYRGYQDAWNTFNRIQTYNINVSTMKATGTTGIYYYQFADFTEKGQFTNGRALHIRRYPNSNWDPVSET